MPSLFVIQGRDQGQRYELTEVEVSVGRDVGNLIQLHDTEVSRRHVLLRHSVENESYWLVDLGSSNGTFVNNQRVERHTLNSGDRIQIGRTLMIYTGRNEGESDDISAIVDIVGRAEDNTESRIIKSLRREEQPEAIGSGQSESSWLARARANLQVMYHTALAVSHTMDIDQLLTRIMDLIFEWVDADRGCVMLLETESSRLQPRVLRHRAGTPTGEKMTISQTILDYVMQNKEGVLTSDARHDERWEEAGSILKLGVREAIGVPMQGRYGVVGIIYIDTFTPPGRFLRQGDVTRFNEEHLKLMIAIGHQAALAVEDTYYYSAMMQAERLAAIGQTIAGLSHHIKNILQGIRGGSYLIDEGLRSNESELVRKGWSIVEKNQDKIHQLVMDMLTFSKERTPDLQSADLNQVVADVVELMQVRAQERNVELVWQPAAHMPSGTFDPDAMHRAILNIVTNAIDACDDIAAGRVTITTEYSDSPPRLQVTVVDNGPGIPPDDHEKIFQMFESRKGSRGTGLGLPVSQKILHEHGGEIELESQLGKGSRFTLRWPAHLAPAESSSAARPDSHHDTKHDDDKHDEELTSLESLET